MNGKQAHLTLKEYLHQYLAAKSPKTATQDQAKSIVSELDCEKMFSRKLFNIKKLVKNYIKDSYAQSLLQKELEELKTIFKESRGFIGNNSKDIQQTTCLTKKSVKDFRKKNISIPIIPIIDDSLDDIRITHLASSQQKREAESKNILKENQIPEIKIHQAENNPPNQHGEVSPKIYKAYSREYTTKVIPSVPSSVKSRRSDQEMQNDCLPPTLDKKYSLFESIRNTRKTITENRVNQAKGVNKLIQ